MALTIIQQPDSLQPVPVRNPIEIALETDKYILAVTGQKTMVTVNFTDISTMSSGNQFEVNCKGTITLFDIVDVLTNENQILKRSLFASDNLYADHIHDQINAHSTIGLQFQSFYSSGSSDEALVRFTSVINEPAVLIFTKISGGYDISNSITLNGRIDEYDTRTTIFKIGMLFVSQGDPLDGDFFAIQIDGKSSTFYFRSTPNNLGFELPLRGALSLSDYQALLLLRLKGAPCFTDKFEVTTSIFVGEIYFTFTSIGYVQGSIDNTNNSSKYVLTNEPGYQAIYQSNFTTNVRLYCEKNYNAGNFEKIIDLYSYPINEPVASVNHFVSRFKIDNQLYDFMNKIYSENLVEALPYIANYPNAKHLFKKFYFRFNENYGEPATDKLIVDSAKYIAALYGIGHLSFVDRKSLNGFGFLHPSGQADNPLALKQYIDKEQPLWLYYYINANSINEIDPTGSSIFLKMYFSDGTNITTDITYGPAVDGEIDNPKTFFIKADYKGFEALFFDYESPAAQVYMYDIIIVIGDNEVVAKKTFVLDCCSSYKSYLMYQNSYGGYDTVTISAPKEYSLDITDGKEVERILPAKYSKTDSQFEATIPKARQSVKANVGFKKDSDFDVLKELLISKHVFILPKGTTDVFIPINIDRKSVVLESEDDYEKNFSIEFSPAHEFKNFENNLWLK